MGAEKRELVSVDDYLSAEEVSEVRHEYLAGLVYAMSGASRNHNAISLNIASALKEAMGGGPCQVFMSDMRVRITSPATGEVFYYPDVVVTCDPEDNASHHVERPSVIFEVLSETTERIDRREKRLCYQHLPSLKQYVLVAQDSMRVESLIVGEGGFEVSLESNDARLELPSLGCHLSLATIYEGVFPGE